MNRRPMDKKIDKRQTDNLLLNKPTTFFPFILRKATQKLYEFSLTKVSVH